HDHHRHQSGGTPRRPAVGPRHPESSERGIVQRGAAEGTAHDGPAAPGRFGRQQRSGALVTRARPPDPQQPAGRPRLVIEAQCRMGVPHDAARRGPARGRRFPCGAWQGSRPPLHPRHRSPAGRRLMGLAGVLLGLALLVWLAFRGWTVLLLAPAAALLAAAFAGEPLLAHWTQTFMGSAAQFLAQFFPLFLMGALVGKLMEDSGSVSAIARWMTERLGTGHAMLAVVLAGALVTYGGVSLFVAFFVLAPMAEALFRAAAIPRALMPAAIALGTSTFTMSALPGTPAIQNAIHMPFFGTTPFAAPGLGVVAAPILLGFGLWWLARAEASARQKGEGYRADADVAVDASEDQLVRERATTSSTFDPAEIRHGYQ